MNVFLDLRLEVESLVDGDVPVTKSAGNLHVQVLKLTVVVIGHPAVELKATIIHTEYKANNTKIPRHSKSKGVLDTLEDLARKHCMK